MGNRTIACACALLLVLMATLAGCGRDGEEAQRKPPPTPAETVRLLTGHLADGQLDAFARDAVPPELHASLQQAWREGRTRWPLDQLPFAPHIPRAMAVLSAPDAERDLQQAFDRQLANTSLAAAAEFLTIFTTQYISRQGDFSDAEREHYPQLVQALGTWAAQAPLGDRARAQAAIAALSSAAREAALDTDAAFAEAGLDDGLRRISRMATTLLDALKAYGLDLPADLRAMDVQLQSQTGDVALVRMQYTVAGSPIDTVVQLERHDGRWYVSDFLRHARDALQRRAPDPAPGPPADAGSEAPAA
ncbi:hypothetical protein L599_004500000150 [Luteimonas sp. J16]|jgi:hypothetical protein|uniref:hypothetical protein n=1 Tax=unclassified Luteimonas TaxID=2629088 RepID=UPI0004B85921|nr:MULTISPECIES: hypothetical protein [unclassified Luteimonas]TWG89398.1 hypothetical protein L599_004500000150 [Luteimonas sp. J16]